MNRTPQNWAEGMSQVLSDEARLERQMIIKQTPVCPGERLLRAMRRALLYLRSREPDLASEALKGALASWEEHHR